jgi:DNA replication protein DnaC
MNITNLAVKLRLPYVRENWQQLVDEAQRTKQDYTAFLENVLDYEWNLRLENGQARRLKEAKFPLKKYLVDFKRDKYDAVFLPKFEELGYVSMDKVACETLFNLISSRNEKGSIIATSNLTFDRWEEVFKDPTLTGALIDRLAHKAHVLDISRDKGGRFEETMAWLESGAMRLSEGN